MEKLSQLREQMARLPSPVLPAPDWDLIVVDTPPSRSALDFLDAPESRSEPVPGRSDDPPAHRAGAGRAARPI